MLDLKRVLASKPKKPEHVILQDLTTPWTEEARRRAQEAESSPTDVSCHPHPQFARDWHESLNGWWDYRFVRTDIAAKTWGTAPMPVAFEGRIRVPFSPEAPLSDVGRRLEPDELLWYRRSFRTPELPARWRCILHFEAVDYACACYVNGIRMGEHQGGYLPFSFDITGALAASKNEIALCVWDPSETGTQLRGKQRLERGEIWYTAQSGIWQEVWLEVVPERHLHSIALDPQADAGRLRIRAQVESPASASKADKTPVTAELGDGDEKIAEGMALPDATGACEIVLEMTSPHLWSPEDPHLYQIELTYGEDLVHSYCAFRTASVEADEAGTPRFCLNHKPYFLRGVLDQGYWPDGLLSTPSDEALVHDIETMRNLGFNTLRKHIKVECDRWYWHCDRLGMLVWQDMVSGGDAPDTWASSYKPTLFRSSWGRYADDEPDHLKALAATDATFRDEWTRTCMGTVEHLRNHPCVVTWVLFNEAWGQFDAKAATEAVRELDPTRPIDATSGWYDQQCGDYLSVHNYFRPLEVYRDRARPKRAFVISEFGGLSHLLERHSSLDKSYGYDTYADLSAFKAAVREQLDAAQALEPQGLSGYVYTQLSDVEEETNGLLSYDRQVNKMEDED